MKLLSITFITAATIAGSAIAAPVREHRPPDVESARQLQREAGEHQRQLEQAEHYHEFPQVKRAKPEQDWTQQPASFTVAKQAPSKELPLTSVLNPPPPKQAKPKQKPASFTVAQQAPSLTSVLNPPPPKQAKPRQTQPKPEHDWKQPASFRVAKQAPSKEAPLSGVLVPPKARE